MAIGEYIASKPLAIIGAIGFGAVTLCYIFHLVRQGRRWMLVLIFGSGFMTLGFVVRYFSHDHPDTLLIYIIQTLFILLSPCAFLAANYMGLARLARYLGPQVAQSCLLLRVNWLSKIFVCGDILTFLIQSAGGGMTAAADGDPDKIKLSENISKVGIILQAGVFAMYTVILVVFGARVRSRFSEIWTIAESGSILQPARGAVWNPFDKSPVLDWRVYFWVLVATSICFLIRSIYRVAEFMGGYDSVRAATWTYNHDVLTADLIPPIRQYLYSTEWPLYMFDCLPLLLGLFVYVIFWPPRFMKCEAAIQQENAELKDVESGGEAVDPFLSPSETRSKRLRQSGPQYDGSALPASEGGPAYVSPHAYNAPVYYAHRQQIPYGYSEGRY